jgi:PAS domain S-box-containing protein
MSDSALRRLVDAARAQAARLQAPAPGEEPAAALGALARTLQALSLAVEAGETAPGPAPDPDAQVGQLRAELARAQAALQAKTEELEKFFNLMPDLLCIADTSGHFVRLNPMWEKTLGYSQAELMARPFADFVHPDDLARTATTQDLSAQELIEHFENRYRGRDGRYHWFEWNSFPAGERIYAAARDVTERKQTEAALRASETRLRSILESNPVGMHLYRLEADGRLVFTGANPAADRILGVDHSQFVGQTIEEAFPPLVETEVPAQYRAVAAGGGIWHLDQINYQDRQIAGAYEVTAFQYAPGEMVAAFTDITDRTRAEAALRLSEEKFSKAFHTSPDSINISRLADGVYLEGL